MSWLFANSNVVSMYVLLLNTLLLCLGGLLLITYAPIGGGGGQIFYKCSLHITCKKGGGGPDIM